MGEEEAGRYSGESASHPQMACVSQEVGAPSTHHLSYPGREATGARGVCDVRGFHGPLGGPKEKRISFRLLISQPYKLRISRSKAGLAPLRDDSGFREQFGLHPSRSNEIKSLIHKRHFEFL